MDNGFGQLLKLWRQRLGLSQLALSLQSGISAKHISFLENGKSQPSREMVNTLAMSMSLSAGDCNLLLKQAGLQAPANTLNQGKTVKALQMILDKHAPYPGIISNYSLQPQMYNHSAIALLQWLDIDLSQFSNVMDIIFSEKGLRSVLVNWAEITSIALRLIKLKSLTMQDDVVFQTSLSNILANEELRVLWDNEDASGNGVSNTEPVIPCKIMHKGHSLYFEAILMTYGTPRSVSLEEYQLELFYPADEISKDFCHQYLMPA